MTVVITREWAPYEDVEWYIDNYMNQYYLDEYYQESNNITLLENKKYEHNGAKAQFISLRRSPQEQKPHGRTTTPTFCTLKNRPAGVFFA